MLAQHALKRKGWLHNATLTYNHYHRLGNGTIAQSLTMATSMVANSTKTMSANLFCKHFYVGYHREWHKLNQKQKIILKSF